MNQIFKVFTFVIILCLGISNQANGHIEIVANIAIEHADDGLTIAATLDKRHLTYALKKEAKCKPKNMIRVCANQYVTDNISIIVNDKSVVMTLISQRLTKSNLIITYKVKFRDEIKKVVVKSNYMIKYNDHSKVKVVSKLKAENKIYSLTAKRKKITITV